VFIQLYGHFGGQSVVFVRDCIILYRCYCYCLHPLNLRVTQVTTDAPVLRLWQGIGFAAHAPANWLAPTKRVMYLNTHTHTHTVRVRGRIHYIHLSGVVKSPNVQTGVPEAEEDWVQFSSVQFRGSHLHKCTVAANELCIQRSLSARESILKNGLFTVA